MLVAARGRGNRTQHCVCAATCGWWTDRQMLRLDGNVRVPKQSRAKQSWIGWIHPSWTGPPQHKQADTEYLGPWLDAAHATVLSSTLFCSNTGQQYFSLTQLQQQPPATSVFLSHHSSSSLQHQPSEQGHGNRGGVRELAQAQS